MKATHSFTPFISAVMIVRNEEQCIATCLDSLRRVVDEIVVVDTGSTDMTLSILKHYPITLFHRQWDGSFSHARNFGIEKAAGPYILTIDADEYVTNFETAREQLHHFIAHTPLDTIGTVELTNLAGVDSFEKLSTHQLSRFFHKAYFTYRGSIHEQLTALDNITKRHQKTGLCLNHTGYAKDNPDLQQKWQRNQQQLLQAIRSEPDDYYLHFQLGKTFFVQKQFASAVASLQRSHELIDWTGNQPRAKREPIPEDVVVDLICSLVYSLANMQHLPQARDILLARKQAGNWTSGYADLPHALGYVHLMMGDIANATIAYRESLACGPGREQVSGTGSYSSNFHLGLLSEVEGNKTLALTYYRKALQDKSDYEPARTQLNSLIQGEGIHSQLSS